MRGFLLSPGLKAGASQRKAGASHQMPLCQFVLIFINRDTDFVVLAFGRIFDEFKRLKFKD